MENVGRNPSASAGDPQGDYFRPPSIPTEVQCSRCRCEFDSWKMQWHEEYCDGEIQGFWCCPTEGCDGKGFGFDIWPTSPNYIDPDGRDLAANPFGDGDDEMAWLEDQWTDDDDWYGFEEPPLC